MFHARDAQASPPVIRREDYAPPAYWIDTVDLSFDLDPTKTRVLNRMRVRRNAEQPPQPLRLDGDELNLARVLVNGQGTSFKMDGDQLVLDGLPDEFDLEIFTTCNPEKNTKLMGLYLSQDTFFTQCEAEGFRRITYFLDRPDVMASFSVTLRADRKRFPVLLSNGNLVEQGVLEDGRHFAKWVDPHRKPCYLFAIVAGCLAAREQRIVTESGSEHLLQIYVRPGDLDKTEHAMQSLMHSVAWDEARFGLKLDLERFMVVATSDFNMGAMENKGLNIFNTKYVLASPATATDVDFDGIESVIGHEYFHNWTGNRVTCRDWFQLSLKEGLTVFRDQEFSMDLARTASARAVKRIEDVRVLRTVQFPEDAGPMAHPVRPDQYAEINNFYTVTVYEKGAEVVRMYQTLLGREGFAKGLALYFERHDGQAVTCDDFAQAMSDANPGSTLALHLDQFKRWYSQAGTPRVTAVGQYDAEGQRYTLTLSQTCPATPGQAEKQPFVIPVIAGLVAPGQGDLAVSLHGGEPATAHTLVLTEPSQQFVFERVTAEPVPSLLRGFSAPVVLNQDLSDAELLALLAQDSDPFNAWEAGQRLLMRQLLAAVTGAGDLAAPLQADAVAALRSTLRRSDLDAAFKALVLTLPTESYLAEQLADVDPQRVHAVREAARRQLARDLAADWAWAFDEHEDNGSYRPDPVSSGRRSLAGLALGMLVELARETGDSVWPGKAYQRTKDAGNMTDRYAATAALVNAGHALAQPALTRFHDLFADDALVIDKWFALQAAAPDRGGDALGRVEALLRHPDFNARNPNRARSLIFSFTGNPAAFHRTDGAGYTFWREQLLAIDAFNPQVAARLARALDRWKKLAEPYRSAAHGELQKVAAHPSLSKDVREIVEKALAA
ncbi:aminopeptidase N [Comamonas serinivorans]|uniref:Aminopeptidase N n=1 Tax=Comamonas serinivorans TaxID=1082851 RepID=A0A1Y0ER72_9BURK|nr:aminopeptidase N [Comamonas serinivorans]ARU05809.1 aminopeptidase N [Comamonas serinivorans]